MSLSSGYFLELPVAQSQSSISTSKCQHIKKIVQNCQHYHERTQRTLSEEYMYFENVDFETPSENCNAPVYDII